MVSRWDRGVRVGASLGAGAGAMGHEVRLIAPQLAKPYVKRGKNDAADAMQCVDLGGRRIIKKVTGGWAYCGGELGSAGGGGNR